MLDGPRMKTYGRDDPNALPSLRTFRCQEYLSARPDSKNFTIRNLRNYRVGSSYVTGVSLSDDDADLITTNHELWDTTPKVCQLYTDSQYNEMFGYRV